jgi:hypothetical protein
MNGYISNVMLVLIEYFIADYIFIIFLVDALGGCRAAVGNNRVPW